MSDTTFPEHEYLTVRELAELLRLKERKIYDLAASGAVPCSRATGKLLFPAADIRAWIAGAQSGGSPDTGPRPPIVLGSHDPLLDWAIRESRCGLATYFDGSLDGLDRFVQGEGIAAGLHVLDAASGEWNVPVVSARAAGQNAVLISFAARNRGLITRPGGPSPRSMSDLAGLRVVPRQPESGTDGIFRQMAAAAGLDSTSVTLTAVARTEDDAAEAVARSEADAAFGLETVARAYGLEFTPVMTERYGLLVDRRAWFEPPFQRLKEFLSGDAFRVRAETASGYDVAEFGAVLWNG